MKLKSCQMFRTEDVPDHILEEMKKLSVEMAQKIFPLIETVSPNIVLGALNWMHAAMINHLVVDTEESIDIAAKQQAACLYHNANHAYKIRHSPEYKDQEC